VQRAIDPIRDRHRDPDRAPLTDHRTDNIAGRKRAKDVWVEPGRVPQVAIVVKVIGEQRARHKLDDRHHRARRGLGADIDAQ